MKDSRGRSAFSLRFVAEFALTLFAVLSVHLINRHNARGAIKHNLEVGGDVSAIVGKNSRVEAWCDGYCGAETRDLATRLGDGLVQVFVESEPQKLHH